MPTLPYHVHFVKIYFGALISYSSSVLCSIVVWRLDHRLLCALKYMNFQNEWTKMWNAFVLLNKLTWRFHPMLFIHIQLLCMLCNLLENANFRKWSNRSDKEEFAIETRMLERAESLRKWNFHCKVNGNFRQLTFNRKWIQKPLSSTMECVSNGISELSTSELQYPRR